MPSRVTVSASGDTNGSRVTTTGYTADGYFASARTQAAGTAAAQTTSSVFRARDGQASRAVDAMGRATLFQYDAFGALQRTQFRGTTDSVVRMPDRAISRTYCRGEAGCPAFIAGLSAYRVTEVQDGAPTITSYFDVLDRLLKTETRLLDGTMQVVEKRYNQRGLLIQESIPRRTGEAAAWMTYSNHDPIGRVGTKIVPKQLDDGFSSLVTTYTYSGRSTRIEVKGVPTGITNCAFSTTCLSMERIEDAAGRFVRTFDALAGRTDYWYDANGNPLAIRDANNAVLSVVYNAVGHRTQVRDPNMGTWNFLYNGLGEVTQQTDARGVVTSYSYDALGRRTGRVASVDIDGVAPIDSVADVWTYDPPFARGELAGAIRRLNNVRQKEVTYTYDSQQLGRMVRADSVVRDSTSFEQTFTTQHAYDAYYGRLKQSLYPVGDNVQFLYSRYGHLREERDLVTNSSLRLVSAVDARGQPSSEALAGGSVVTTYTYGTSEQVA
jgi:YD repeat-containing protein